MTRPTLSIVFAVALAAGCADGAKPAAPASTPAPDAAKTAPAGAYPLTTCVISGDKLGGMGPAVVRTYDGTEVQFCCDSCIPEFEKDQAKYLAIVRAAKK